MSLEHFSPSLCTDIYAKKRPADSPLNSFMCYRYQNPYAINIDGDRDSTDNSDFLYIPLVKRQRKECNDFSIFGQYGFFPIDGDSEEIQHGDGETARADRRRSSDLSFLSSLSFFNEQEISDEEDVDCCDISDEDIESLIHDNLLSSSDARDHHADDDNITPSLPEKKDASFPSTSVMVTDAFATTITVSERIIPTDLDVLFGRGQGRNKHPGNERFRTLINKIRPLYLAQGKSKKKKNALSKYVMECVFAYGGRFLEIINDGTAGTRTKYHETIFVEVDDKRARKKCSQRLRETKK